MNKLSSLKKYVINMKIRRKVLLIFLLVGVLPFLCYIIFSNRYTNQIMLERETSLTESALQQAVQSVENKLETYNNLSNYMFNNTSILQALNTEYSKDYFRMYKAYQDTIEPLFQTYYALHPGLENITIYSSCDLHPYNGYVVSLDKLKEKEYYPAVRNNYIPVWIVYEEEDSQHLYSIRQIGDTGRYKSVNYLSLKLDYDDLFAPLLSVYPAHLQAFCHRLDCNLFQKLPGAAGICEWNHPPDLCLRLDNPALSGSHGPHSLRLHHIADREPYHKDTRGKGRRFPDLFHPAG